MSANFNQAINELGTTQFSRWLLPDGQFLDVADYEDHRMIGCYCTENWREFIKEGAMSIHYDDKCGYMWIRTIGLTFAQMWAMREVFDNLELGLSELKVDYYSFETLGEYNVDEIVINESEIAILYLTDQIAYRCLQSERTN